MSLNFAIDISTQLEDGTTEMETVNAQILTHPSEITLKRWASYFQRLDKMPDWFKEFHNAKDEAERVELQKEWTSEKWAKSYVLFAKLSLTFVNNARLEDMLEMPLGRAEAESADSLLSLFLLTVNTVYGYKPISRKTFEHRGRKFKAFVSKSIAGQEMPGADMTVRDAINALQIEHSWENHTENRANEYNINVGVLAALSREVLKGGKVEKPPVDGPAYLQWQWERQELFEDIPMDIALDVVFFSTGLKALSPNIPLSLSSLMQASPAA